LLNSHLYSNSFSCTSLYGHQAYTGPLTGLLALIYMKQMWRPNGRGCST